MIKKLLLGLALLLLPGVADAATYYVDKGSGSASNSNACTSTALPCLTIGGGLSKMSGGDTLQIRAGTYAETISPAQVPSGTGTGSTYTAPTTIQAFPGEDAIITGSGGLAPLQFSSPGAAITKQYIIFKGTGTKNLIFDSLNATIPAVVIGGGSNGGDLQFIRLDGITARNVANNSVVFIGGDDLTGHDSEIINSVVHDWTSTGNQHHGIYIGLHNNLIENNLIYTGEGFGIHLQHTATSLVNNNRVLRNIVHDVCSDSPTCAGIVEGNGSGNVIANNLVYNIRGASPFDGGIGIDSGSSSTSALIYGNTIYNTTWFGIGIQGSGTQIKNNILSSTGTANGNVAFNNSGSGTTYASNLCSAAGTNCSLVEASATTFVAPGTNFTLKAGSAAINGGTTLGAPYNTDQMLTTRPQGAAYDIGALELAATPTCPSLPNALIAQYRFEGVSTDSSGNGLTATLGTGWSYTTGKYGQGVTTTGVSGITIADNDLLDFCNGFTLELHVNLPSLLTDVAFINKNPDSKYFLGTFNGYCDPAQSLMGGYTQVSQVFACTAPLLTTGIFNHLAVSYDGTTVSLYRNGSPVATAAGGAVLDATTGTLQICTSDFAETCPAGTIIDEVKIYRGPRTGAQILADMMDGSTPANVVLKIPSGATGLKLGGAGAKLGAQSQ